jgi:hypothetical protein
MHWINRTPFPGATFVDTDHRGTETLVTVLKATYRIDDSGAPKPAAKQRDLLFTDTYAGAPGLSSLVYETDANWGRTGADVALIGHALPQRAGDREVRVGLRVGDMVRMAHVFGDRQWTTHMGTARAGAPLPFERMPLIYERAFGGVDDSPEDPAAHESEPRNPVGRGLRARRSRQRVDGAPLPNIEMPDRLIKNPDDRPEPIGFTFTARSWQARQQFAGTYDADWQSSRMPLLPADFDPRYFRAASPGLHAGAGLVGGEPVDLLGLTPGGRLAFALPKVPLHAAFGLDARVTEMAPRMSAVIIDTVRMELVICWHASHPVQGLVDDIGWVFAGHESLEQQVA